jgi:imidazolonepropionase-like amidohydrolase
MWRLLFVVFALVYLPSASAQVTAIARVTLIDGSGTAPLNDATIVMEQGRIRDIGPSAQVAVPPGATVVDGTGRFVVPGIINGHGHRPR